MRFLLYNVNNVLINAKYIHWDMDPVLFNLGPIKIHWYGLIFMMSFIFAFLFMQRIFRLEGRAAINLEKLFVYVLIGTILGARLGHCLFYDPSHYLSAP